ncbi:hypothetical protein DSO57_1021424 [Entomophthora muscae]|uniref:Uncharacterized protein n=1 Tax=Entomophthora muscae TaxID=34485 RepID=A0ACC2T3K3_9FUNG|nr:hypothetical protein DSO57_1021424 [Entomophthora muscae]
MKSDESLHSTSSQIDLYLEKTKHNQKQIPVHNEFKKIQIHEGKNPKKTQIPQGKVANPSKELDTGSCEKLHNRDAIQEYLNPQKGIEDKEKEKEPKIKEKEKDLGDDSMRKKEAVIKLD